LKVHEYQAKEILARFGVPVPRGQVASTVDEAVSAAKALGGESWVVKAQIHAGGRGKGGGVKISKGLDELRRNAGQILGMNLITPQTGPAGQRVKKVLVTEATDIRREYYLGMVLDRRIAMPVLMASAEGGVEIEEVAARSPEKIIKEVVNPLVGLRHYQGRVIAKKIGLPGDLLAPAATLMVGLTRAFLETDASLAEVNPLALAGGQGGAARLLALDAKFAFDDNALFRHPDIAAYRDVDEEDPLEVRASRSDLSYIRLDGQIGCMVNGAGLAMATLDILKHEGGSPANFLDVGGGATAAKVTEAFKIILEDPHVKAVLVNIFGGIMQCDKIARAITAAAKEVGFKVPLVVRLEGTNVDEAREILNEAKRDIPTMQTATDLTDAAKRVCAAVK
jgi:succinyl-CoA synthetase beta subunit